MYAQGLALLDIRLPSLLQVGSIATATAKGRHQLRCFSSYPAAAAQQAVSCSFRLRGAVTVIERHAVSALKGAAPVLARRAPHLHAHTFRAKARALRVGAATPIRAIKVIPHVRFATVRV